MLVEAGKILFAFVLVLPLFPNLNSTCIETVYAFSRLVYSVGVKFTLQEYLQVVEPLLNGRGVQDKL